MYCPLWQQQFPSILSREIVAFWVNNTLNIVLLTSKYVYVICWDQQTQKDSNALQIKKPVHITTVLYIIHIRHWTDLMIVFSSLMSKKAEMNLIRFLSYKKNPHKYRMLIITSKNKLHFLISVINTRGRSVFCTLL